MKALLQLAVFLNFSSLYLGSPSSLPPPVFESPRTNGQRHAAPRGHRVPSTRGAVRSKSETPALVASPWTLGADEKKRPRETARRWWSFIRSGKH